MKKIQTKYEMDDYITSDARSFTYISEDIVKGFKSLVSNYKEYQETIKKIDKLKNKIISDDIIKEIVSEKIDNLIKTKEYYERIMNRTLDGSKFEENKNVIYEMKLISGIDITFRDMFASKAEIEKIVQVAVMGQGMGIRADYDEYKIEIVNRTKDARITMLYVDI